MTNNCNHMVDFVKKETSDLREEIALNRYFLSKKNKKTVDAKFAESDYLSNYVGTWSEAERAAYCTFICPEKSCVSRDEWVEKLNQDIEIFKNNFFEETGQTLSTEEAQMKYLSARGPSFWKGIAGLVFPLILKQNLNSEQL